MYEAWNGNFKQSNNPSGKDWAPGKKIASNMNAILKNPTNKFNTWPLLSIEHAHDNGLINGHALSDKDNQQYAVSGAEPWANQTCVARALGGDTCGTFDGFALWTWNHFAEFINQYTAKPLNDSTEPLKQIGIYEWQFVPKHWMLDQEIAMVDCDHGQCTCTGCPTLPK